MHEERLTEKVKADSKLINKTISRFFNQILALNLDSFTPVKFRFILPEQKNYNELETKSKIIQNLTNSGYEIPAKYIIKTFNIEDITKKEPLLQNNKIELNRLNQTKELQTKALEEEILEYIATILDECNSYDELLDKLLEQYSFIDLKSLEDILLKEGLYASIEGSLKAGNDATE